MERKSIQGLKTEPVWQHSAQAEKHTEVYFTGHTPREQRVNGTGGVNLFSVNVCVFTCAELQSMDKHTKGTT